MEVDKWSFLLANVIKTFHLSGLCIEKNGKTQNLSLSFLLLLNSSSGLLLAPPTKMLTYTLLFSVLPLFSFSTIFPYFRSGHYRPQPNYLTGEFPLPFPDGKASASPFLSPELTKTRGRYASSFSISAEFSNRRTMAALPCILA